MFHRLICALTLTGALAAAQGNPTDSVTVLEQAAQKATTAWQSIAANLDSRVARMLPCDPRAKTAIDEVARASQARLAALAQYWQAAATLTAGRAEGARRLLAKEEARTADVNADRAQREEALAAIQQQAAALAESANLQAALAGPQSGLAQIVDMAQHSAALARNQADQRDLVVGALRNLVSAYQAHDAALRDAASAFETERGRWNSYYAARQARAQTECAITTAAPARPPAKPAPKGKQK